ncbi:hypothetical protein E2C01_077158 [Portunus trituberculatus]|uniref:Uncharacterized protein n=1 Tax=Portunus trituberculatus TaxID=210409 RepID=A0A5B7INU4_PORTR|nr:hypothetical protein [Portunus trituberculatus]
MYTTPTNNFPNEDVEGGDGDDERARRSDEDCECPWVGRNSCGEIERVKILAINFLTFIDRW